MEKPQRASYNGFMGTPAAKVLGLVLGFGIPFGMMAAGLYSNTCLFVFVGVILFVVPKIFGVKRFATMAVLGVAFLLVTSLVGAFCFTVPALKDTTQSDISGTFHDVTITRNGDTYDVTVEYDGTGTVEMYTPTVGTTSFKVISFRTDTDAYTMTSTSGTTHTYTGLKLDSGTLYTIYFKCGDDKSSAGMIDANVSDSDISNHALKWNFYATGLATIVFFLVLILTSIMRKNLEKTRAKLEAEGRLYPQGYGRCKECGMLVLPGETVCRKCGTYIDVPEEIKAKMKQKVEYTICSECGAEVPQDARRCPKCGADFNEEEEEVRIEATPEIIEAHTPAPAENRESFECSECGARVPGDAKKCPKCGATFDDE